MDGKVLKTLEFESLQLHVEDSHNFESHSGKQTRHGFSSQGTCSLVGEIGSKTNTQENTWLQTVGFMKEKPMIL